MANYTENETKLIGNLADKPEIRPTSNGGKMAIMNLYTQLPSYRDDAGALVEGRRIKHRVVSFQKQIVNFAEHLDAGERVVVKGYNDNREYTDGAGQKAWMQEVVAQTLASLDTKETKQIRADKRAARQAA